MLFRSVTPQLAGGKAASSAFPIPSSSVTESVKDKAIAVATAAPPGPGQSTLVSIPPYSGPVPARPDASGQFPLAALVEKRAKEQLADVSLLRSSVEYALSYAAKCSAPTPELYSGTLCNRSCYIIEGYWVYHSQA